MKRWLSLVLLAIMGIALALIAGFAVIAALLAAVGLYGLLAYSVLLRTREIGIRVALGADRMRIVRAVLSQGLVLVAIGAALGLPASLLAARALRDLLFHVNVVDWVSLTGAALLLLFVAFAAGIIPARRAMQVDPMVAIRYE